MAPEVIRNSSCCSLAVDIWGLGCTILEMATTKPPWSQCGGVPALYKIGNSKELPAIPEHLSEEAKNFIRQCLLWNPQHRPTAMQLLEHPFVKIASPVERPVLSSDPPQPTPLLYNAASSMEMGHLKNFSRLDSEGADIPLSSGSKITSAPRDAYMLRNISCPVSSIGSPLLHPKSPQRKSGQLSPICNLHGGAPGSSPPHTVGSGTTPWTVLQQPATSLYDGIGIQKCRKNLYARVSPLQEWKHRFFHGTPQMSLPYKEIVSLINRQPKEQHDGRLVLADRVSSALEGSY